VTVIPREGGSDHGSERQEGYAMSQYEHPYRLDAAVVADLLEHLNRLIHASNEATWWDQDALRVPLLTAHHLHTLMNVSFWTSFKQEEGRAVTIAVKYVPPDEAYRPFLLKQALPYTEENIIRLSPVLQGVHVDLGVCIDHNDQLMIWGFDTGEFRMTARPYLYLHSLEPGLIRLAFAEVNIIFTGTRIVCVDKNFLYSEALATLVGPTYLGPDIQEIITEMAAHRHGGTLLIVPENDVWSRSIKEPILYASDPPFDKAKISREMLNSLADHRARYHHEYGRLLRLEERHVREHGTQEERLDIHHHQFLAGHKHRFDDALMRSLKLTGQLTAVDGAVIVNDDLKVLAFGAKIKPLDTRQSPETLLVSESSAGSVPLEVSLSEFGGTRHQSAAQFVFDQRQAVAFVASQDGIITLLTWHEGVGSVAAVRHIELTL
jgi:hypothetical protein